jgi:hypothetical protein
MPSKIVDDGNWSGVERYALNIREKHVSAFLDRQIPSPRSTAG